MSETATDRSSGDGPALAAITRLLARYCHTCDDGRFDEWGLCFTEDAEFTAMGSTVTGRAGAQAWIEAALPPELRGKHFLGSSVVEVDGATGHGITDYMFISKAGEGSYGITSAGRYHDTYRLDTDGEWRIATREIRFL